MWPLVVSVAVAVLSVAQLVVGRAGGDGERFSRHSWLPLVGLATLLGLALLLPVIGLPLPLVSSGGSALVMTLAALGMVIGFARREAGAADALAARAGLVRRSLAVLPVRRHGRSR